MIKLSVCVLSVAGPGLLLSGQAYDMTLVNRDEVEQRLLVTEGGDEMVTHEVVIEANETLDDLFPEGCTITLDTGQQESSEGNERSS